MRRSPASYADGQFGLVTRAQAMQTGMTGAAIRWQLESGRWVQVHRGVYRTMPGRDDWISRAMAGLLRVGHPAALCGPSAGFLWQLVPHPGDDVHVVVPVTRRPVSTPGLVVARSRHSVERTHYREWPPRIDMDHTVFDLAQGQSLDRAVGLVAKAVQSHRTTVRNLRLALEQRPTQTHFGVLHDVLADVAEGVESSAERRYVNDVERAHGLPTANRQVWSGPWRCDNEYDLVRVKLEVDGRLGHAGWSGQQQDGRRDRRHATGGWLTVRVFWSDVGATPCETAEELSSIFRVRGWLGRPRRCRKGDCRVRP
jgi:hypothetical protein